MLGVFGYEMHQTLENVMGNPEIFQGNLHPHLHAWVGVFMGMGEGFHETSGHIMCDVLHMFITMMHVNFKWTRFWYSVWKSGLLPFLAILQLAHCH